MHMNKIKISLFIALIFICNSTYANNFYLGAEYISDKTEVDKIDGISLHHFRLLDSYDDSYKTEGIFSGYKFHSNFAIEVGYAHSKRERKNFTEQSAEGGLLTGHSETSFKFFRLDLIGIHSLSKNIDLIASLGVISKRAASELSYEEIPPCYYTGCDGFWSGDLKGHEHNTSFQYGIGVQYKIMNDIALRFIFKSILGGFSYSDNIPYSLNFGAQYEF